MTSRPGFRINLFISLLFLAAGLFSIFYLIPVGVDAPSSVNNIALAPAFWPLIIAYGTVFCSVCVMLEFFTIRHVTEESRTDAEQEDDKYILPPPLAILRVAVFVAMLLAFYFSLTTVGVVEASAVILFVMMLYFGERKLWLIVPISFLCPVLLYLFFLHVAGIPIPLGIFAG